MTQTNEEEAIEKFTEAILTEVRSKNGWVFSRLEGKIREMFTTLLTSRDTYWKKRVEEAFQRGRVAMGKEIIESKEFKTLEEKLPTPITNEESK